MENFSKTLAKHLQILCLTSLAVLVFGYGYAQTPKERAKAEYERKIAEELSKYELKGLKTSLLLNKGVFTEDEIEYYRRLPG